MFVVNEENANLPCAVYLGMVRCCQPPEVYRLIADLGGDPWNILGDRLLLCVGAINRCPRD